jgi:hypothetical protein
MTALVLQRLIIVAPGIIAYTVGAVLVHKRLGRHPRSTQFLQIACGVAVAAVALEQYQNSIFDDIMNDTLSRQHMHLYTLRLHMATLVAVVLQAVASSLLIAAALIYRQ